MVTGSDVKESEHAIKLASEHRRSFRFKGERQDVDFSQPAYATQQSEFTHAAQNILMTTKKEDQQLC